MAAVCGLLCYFIHNNGYSVCNVIVTSLLSCVSSGIRIPFWHLFQQSEPMVQELMLKQELRKMLFHHEQKAARWTETVGSCIPALQHIEVKSYSKASQQQQQLIYIVSIIY